MRGTAPLQKDGPDVDSGRYDDSYLIPDGIRSCCRPARWQRSAPSVEPQVHVHPRYWVAERVANNRRLGTGQTSIAKGWSCRPASRRSHRRKESRMDIRYSGATMERIRPPVTRWRGRRRLFGSSVAVMIAAV